MRIPLQAVRGQKRSLAEHEKIQAELKLWKTLMLPSKENPTAVPNSARKIFLVIGILFLLDAAMNLFFDNAASLSTGRWSWIYNAVTAVFGIHAYPALQAAVGVFCIALAGSKASPSA